MPVSESFKKKYSLNGEIYSATNADRAISDLFACIGRLHTEAAASAERAAVAEKQTAELAAESRALIDENKALCNENAELRATIDELQQLNSRLTAKAEQMDRRLASVGVTVSANDKKLAESSERLYALVERAEKMFGTLDERTAALCHVLEERTDELCRAALSAAKEEPKYSCEAAAEEDTLVNDRQSDEKDASCEAEAAPVAIIEDEAAPEDDIETHEPDDEAMEEDTDPNLFGEDEPSSVDEASDDLSSVPAEDGSDETSDVPSDVTDDEPVDEPIENGDEDNVIAALKRAISKDTSANDKAPEPDIPAEKIDTVPADDEIKNMLTAMYSGAEEVPEAQSADDGEAQSADKAEDTANTSANDQSNTDKSTTSGYGNMKSSLDAIRRRLGK